MKLRENVVRRADIGSNKKLAKSGIFHEILTCAFIDELKMTFLAAKSFGVYSLNYGAE